MLQILRSTQEVNPVTRRKSWDNIYQSFEIEKKNNMLLNDKVEGFVEYIDILEKFFLNKNIDKYDVVIGMYHDQVLTPIKTLFNFKAINITLGLPFIRISPDHGPNSPMLGKNISDPASFFYAMKFAEKMK